MDSVRLISEIREHHKKLIDLATGKVTDNFYETYEKARTDLIQTDQSISTAIPKWIYENRYGSNFWTFISRVSPNYKGRRDFIDRTFSDLYEFVEKGANQPVSISLEEINLAIKNEYIDFLWKKIHSRRTFDKDGALTACRTLVESALKHLLDEKEIIHTTKDDIKDLYKKASDAYGLRPSEQGSEGFTNLYSGCISIIDGIAKIRNKYGDAHGKSGDVQDELEQYHVDFVVNITGSMVTFLLSLTKESPEETATGSEVRE